MRLAGSLILFALAGCGPEPRPREEPDAGHAGPIEDPLLDSPFAGENLVGSVTVIASAADVPLGGHRLDLHEGDLMLRHEGSVAVVSAKHGQVIAFGEVDGKNGLVSLEPVAFIALDAAPRDVVRVEPQGPHVVHVVKQIQTEPIVVESWIHLRGRALTIASQLVSTGKAIIAVTLGEVTSWSNTPTWLEGHGLLLSGGSYGGSFLGRLGPGRAYALCEEGRLNVKISAPSLPGLHRSPKTGGTRISLDAGARSATRRITLTYSDQSIGDAAMDLPCAGPRDLVEVPAQARAHAIETARCETEREHAARLAGADKALEEKQKLVTADNPYVQYEAGRERIAVPTRCARVRLVAMGHAPGAWIDPRRSDAEGWAHEELLPKAGTLRWRIRDKADAEHPLPAQIVVRGKGETASPNWGESGEEGAARNFIYSVADGSRAIPPGSYEIGVYHGFEHSAHRQDVQVKAGAEVVIEADLERVVDTAGWISADLHVHASPSWDAPALLEDRMRSLAAVGVEVAVATDHNAVTDYKPVIESLHLGAHLVSIIGDEVTTDDPLLGHFNVFPLAAGSDPVAYEEVSPSRIFELARERANGGVIQVNHPRMGDIGYFELLHLDRGDVPGWTARSTLGDMSFDAIEVFNGDHYDDIEEVRWVLEDWYALLDTGLHYAATGNSDSHKLAYHDAGVPRNFVALATDDPARFDREAFVRSIREARVVVSTGPFIRLTAGDRGIGDTLAAGPQEINVRVEAAPWVDVRVVELLRNGHLVKRWKVDGAPKPRLDAKHRIDLAAGDWVIAIASGEKELPSVYRKGAPPFAFTNPIWVR